MRYNCLMDLVTQLFYLLFFYRSKNQCEFKSHPACSISVFYVDKLWLQQFNELKTYIY